MGYAVSDTLMTGQRDSRIFEYSRAARCTILRGEKRVDQSSVKQLTVGAGGN